MPASLSPLRLLPVGRERPWASPRLARRLGLNGHNLGEAWLLGEASLVAAPRRERSLAEVVTRYGIAAIGAAMASRFGERLPIYIKLIEAADWLSLQVHPDDATARRLTGDPTAFGKSELWCVLDAAPNACIAYGLRQMLPREGFATAARSGALAAAMQYWRVGRGDVVLVPAGTIHALGPGILSFEVQQPSTLTYRIDDFGRGRELHLDQAAVAACLEPAPLQLGRSNLGGAAALHLAATPWFAVTRRVLRRAVPYVGAPDRCHALCRIDLAGFGQTWLVPPRAHMVLLPGVWLDVFVPDATTTSNIRPARRVPLNRLEATSTAVIP